MRVQLSLGCGLAGLRRRGSHRSSTGEEKSRGSNTGHDFLESWASHQLQVVVGLLPDTCTISADLLSLWLSPSQQLEQFW